VIERSRASLETARPFFLCRERVFHDRDAVAFGAPKAYLTIIKLEKSIPEQP